MTASLEPQAEKKRETGKSNGLKKQGWLSFIDPRPKLLFIPILAPSLFLYKINPYGIIILCALHILLLSSRISIKRIGEIWKSLLLLNALIIGFAALPIDKGWLEGIYRAIRIDALSFLFWVPLLTTTPHQLRRGGQKLGLPHSLALMLEIAVNFLPEFKHQVKTIEEATACRGYSPSNYRWYKRFQNKLPQLLALMVSAIRRSETLGRILETKGYGLNAKRSAFHDITLRTRDVILLLGELIFGTGLYLYPKFLYPLF